jgi:hypothetical protein
MDCDDDEDEDHYEDSYERKLSPFGKFVYRTERRIRRYELKAKLAEAKARVAKSREKPPRKGRSRRQRRVSGDALAARQKPA